MSAAQDGAESGFADGDRILGIDVAEPEAGVSPELDQERLIAIYDLTEESRFRLAAPDQGGPYRLGLAAEQGALTLRVADADGAALAELNAPIEPLRAMVQDYLALCEDYRDAVRRLAPSQIEKIDEARREAHLEGGEALAAALAPGARMDAQTSRRFFTLLCAVLGVEV